VLIFLQPIGASVDEIVALRAFIIDNQNIRWEVSLKETQIRFARRLPTSLQFIVLPKSLSHAAVADQHQEGWQKKSNNNESLLHAMLCISMPSSAKKTSFAKLQNLTFD
jgi:hypothetical protein